MIWNSRLDPLGGQRGRRRAHADPVGSPRSTASPRAGSPVAAARAVPAFA